MYVESYVGTFNQDSTGAIQLREYSKLEYNEGKLKRRVETLNDEMHLN